MCSVQELGRHGERSEGRKSEWNQSFRRPSHDVVRHQNATSCAVPEPVIGILQAEPATNNVEKLEANRAKIDVINANLYKLMTKPRIPSAVAAVVIGEVEDLLGVPPTKKARANEEIPPLPGAEDGNEEDGDMPVVGV